MMRWGDRGQGCRRVVSLAVETHRHAPMPHIKDQEVELSAQCVQQASEALLLQRKQKEKIKNQSLRRRHFSPIITLALSARHHSFY